MHATAPENILSAGRCTAFLRAEEPASAGDWPGLVAYPVGQPASDAEMRCLRDPLPRRCEAGPGEGPVNPARGQPGARLSGTICTRVTVEQRRAQAALLRGTGGADRPGDCWWRLYRYQM